MTKKDILIYGALLEGDHFVDGYGTTEEDTELMQKSLKKVYGIMEGTPEEVALESEKQLNADLHQLVLEYRVKAKEFLS